MSVTCPAGHASTATDWCDVCGAAISSAAISGSPPAAAAPDPAAAAGATDPPTRDPDTGVTGNDTVACPHCGDGNPADALFCESCGYDFTTGQLPPAPSIPAQATVSAPAAWALDLDADAEWFAAKGDGSIAFPTDLSTRTIPLTGSAALVGRTSASRGVHPDVDCSVGADDPAVSRRHCQLVAGSDGTWQIVDLGSTNGTHVLAAAATGDPVALEAGVPKALADGDRVYLGAWTRLTLRHLTPEATA